jgi:hypothetical protein
VTRHDPAADRAAVALVAAGGLMLASLWAPWAQATEGIVVVPGTVDGWEWLTGGVDFGLAAVAAGALAAGTGRHAGRRSARSLVALVAAWDHGRRRDCSSHRLR